MSRRTFEHKNLTVVAGWDRAPREIFMFVTETESDGVIYHNLRDPKADQAQDTEVFQAVLREMNIPTPDGFWSQVEQDRLYNIDIGASPWD